MRVTFFIVKFLPFWALPAMLIALEVAFIFKRRGQKNTMIKALAVASFFLILTVLFFVYRWDKVGIPFLNDLLFDER